MLNYPMSNEHATSAQLDDLGKPAVDGPNSDSRSRFPSGLTIAKFVGLGILVALLIHFYVRGDLTQENLKRIASALPTSLFLPAFLFLPLVGFSINVLLLASGMKYGLVLSLVIATVGMGFHTFAAWHLAHGLFRRRLETWLADTRFEMPTIPKQHQIWFTSLFVTVPGIPYPVKLYSLALTNLPFWRYLLIVWLVHVLNAIPFILIGTAAITLNPMWLVGFGVLALIMVVAHDQFSKWRARRFGQK